MATRSRRSQRVGPLLHQIADALERQAQLGADKVDTELARDIVFAARGCVAAENSRPASGSTSAPVVRPAPVAAKKPAPAPIPEGAASEDAAPKTGGTTIEVDTSLPWVSAESAAAATTAVASTVLSSGTAQTVDGIRADLGDCRRCGLCESRSNIVFGVGDPNARIMFIGEAPGYHEDRRGEPFVGKAGELLDRMIVAMGLSRPEVYIANVLKCRPPDNRDPAADEIAQCLPFLNRQIAAVKPEAIVTLGKFAVVALLGRPVAITRERGTWVDYNGVPLMPTLHPAYLLRNESAKREVWADLKSVMKRLGMSR